MSRKAEEFMHRQFGHFTHEDTVELALSLINELRDESELADVIRASVHDRDEIVAQLEN